METTQLLWPVLLSHISSLHISAPSSLPSGRVDIWTGRSFTVNSRLSTAKQEFFWICCRATAVRACDLTLQKFLFPFESSLHTSSCGPSAICSHMGLTRKILNMHTVGPTSQMPSLTSNVFISFHKILWREVTWGGNKCSAAAHFVPKGDKQKFRTAVSVCFRARLSSLSSREFLHGVLSFTKCPLWISFLPACFTANLLALRSNKSPAQHDQSELCTLLHYMFVVKKRAHFLIKGSTESNEFFLSIFIFRARDYIIMISHCWDQEQVPVRINCECVCVSGNSPPQPTLWCFHLSDVISVN